MSDPVLETDAPRLWPEMEDTVRTELDYTLRKLTGVLRTGVMTLAQVMTIKKAMGKLDGVLSQALTASTERGVLYPPFTMKYIRKLAMPNGEQCELHRFSCASCGSLLAFGGRSESYTKLGLLVDCRRCKRENFWAWEALNARIEKVERKDIRVLHGGTE